METSLISGLQQVGVGVTNVDAAWAWYRKVLGFDIPVFDDTAEAPFMAAYTGNEVQTRRAAMALNMAGGGGLEIWQFTSRQPAPANFIPEVGDFGINALRIKAPNVKKAHKQIKKISEEHVGDLEKLPDGSEGFWGQDPYGNLYQVTSDNTWFSNPRKRVGGVAGVVIGVANMANSLPFYMNLLHPISIKYDVTGVFKDIPTSFPNQNLRRIMLHKGQPPTGAFSRLLGDVSIELVQALDREPRKIYADRYWGDNGFIHVCFDVLRMDELKKNMSGHGYEFTVDSGESFGMESASGRFAYLEDPDGTLVELVETHKLPVWKKIGWYKDLRKRKDDSPLPDWMLGLMRLSRIKD